MIRFIIYYVEGILVGVIGRPILFLVKILRWPILLAGAFLGKLSSYDPVTQEATSRYTFIPLIVCVVLFAMGTTVARYDELAREAYSTWQELEERDGQ